MLAAFYSAALASNSVIDGPLPAIVRNTTDGSYSVLNATAFKSLKAVSNCGAGGSCKALAGYEIGGSGVCTYDRAATTSQSSHYGNPFTRQCLSDETFHGSGTITNAYSGQQIVGEQCSPWCELPGQSRNCPTDGPSGVQGEPQCAIATRNQYGQLLEMSCAVICTTQPPTNVKPVPEGGLITDPNSQRGQIKVSGSFGKAKKGLEQAPDCSDVAGCNSANCDACINLFWATDPNTCTPGCLNIAEQEAKELRSRIAQLEQEVKDLRSRPKASLRAQ